MTISAKVKMGFEGQIKLGAAGSTATSIMENVTDISVNTEPQKGDTTVRGDGSSVPMTTQDVTQITLSIEWTMVDDITDSQLQTLEAAAAAGTAVAIRTVDYAAGKGFDGDVTIGVQKGMPIQGQQTRQFTATPTRSYGRDPLPYV